MSTPKENHPEEKKLLVRLPKKLHRQLKLLAYDLNVSMAELCREGLKLVILSNTKSTERQSKS